MQSLVTSGKYNLDGVQLDKPARLSYVVASDFIYVSTLPNRAIGPSVHRFIGRYKPAPIQLVVDVATGTVLEPGRCFPRSPDATANW